MTTTPFVPPSTRRPRFTRKMISGQSRLNQPLIDRIVALYNEGGHSYAAGKLGVSKATLGYWLLKLGIQTPRIALKPGQSYKIVDVKETFIP